MSKCAEQNERRPERAFRHRFDRDHGDDET
jgi:hypothetical protein